MAIDIDRAGFVERQECCCETDAPFWTVVEHENGYSEWWREDGEHVPLPAADGYVGTCYYCRAELAVFTDPDGTRHPMVRRAGFWRDVALDLADGKADAHPGTPAEWFVKCAVDRVLAADGLNATPAGETMQAEVDDGD